jgi:hypothetical protein
LNLQSHRGFDSGKFHVETILNWHGPGVGQARELEFGIHFRDQLLVGHPQTPLAVGFEHDRGVVHVEGGIVGRAVGPADGAEHTCHLREAAKNTILLLQELCRLADRDSGERRGHIERRALEQRRHELIPELKGKRRRCG